MTCSKQLGALLALVRSPSLCGMTGLERSSLGDKREMEKGSRRQCGWTCSRGVGQSDVHKLGVRALYVQRMCVSASES